MKKLVLGSVAAVLSASLLFSCQKKEEQQPAEQQAAPAPAEQQAAPAPAEQQAAPAPAEQQAAPAQQNNKLHLHKVENNKLHQQENKNQLNKSNFTLYKGRLVLPFIN